jgi:hypothetical protein
MDEGRKGEIRGGKPEKENVRRSEGEKMDEGRRTREMVRCRKSEIGGMRN